MACCEGRLVGSDYKLSVGVPEGRRHLVSGPMSGLLKAAKATTKAGIGSAANIGRRAAGSLGDLGRLGRRTGSAATDLRNLKSALIRSGDTDTLMKISKISDPKKALAEFGDIAAKRGVNKFSDDAAKFASKPKVKMTLKTRLVAGGGALAVSAATIALLANAAAADEPDDEKRKAAEDQLKKKFTDDPALVCAMAAEASGADLEWDAETRQCRKKEEEAKESDDSTMYMALGLGAASLVVIMLAFN